MDNQTITNSLVYSITLMFQYETHICVATFVLSNMIQQ